MNERASQVGVSQRLRVEWLEATANLILAGNGVADIRDALNHMLAGKLSVGSGGVRGSRQKTITILMKIWRNVPPGLEPSRDDGLKMLPALDLNHRHAIHWGMTLAVYPFWGMVAAHTGRLLRLQGTAGAAQVQRRVREQHGERQTVSRAVARVLRSFIDWGVLADADAKGIYAQGKQRELGDARVAAWLAEAILGDGGRAHWPFAALAGHRWRGAGSAPCPRTTRRAADRFAGRGARLAIVHRLGRVGGCGREGDLCPRQTTRIGRCESCRLAGGGDAALAVTCRRFSQRAAPPRPVPVSLAAPCRIASGRALLPARSAAPRARRGSVDVAK